jgi:hypothetical protein
MPTNVQVQSIDELISQLKKKPFMGEVYIDTTIQQDNPKFMGFPMHYKYKPSVSVLTEHTNYIYSSDEASEESPDHELVRAVVRVKSLERGLDIASRLSGSDADIKINELPLEQSKEQLKVYQAELNRVQEAHKDYMWL